MMPASFAANTAFARPAVWPEITSFFAAMETSAAPAMPAFVRSASASTGQMILDMLQPLLRWLTT
jgi:hypothetical protein